MGYVFISYSTKNQLSADAMRELFHKNNIDTWMAPYDIPAGSKYAAVITNALRDCSCFCLLLSNDSQLSEAVDSEVELAVLTFKKPIITIQLEKVILNDSFTFYIHNKQIIAINKIDEESCEIKQVLAAVKAYTENNVIEKSTSREKQLQDNLIYEKQKLLDKLNYLKNYEIEDCSRNSNNLIPIAVLYNNLGHICTELNQFTTAEAYYKESKSIYETLKDTEENKYNLCLVLSNLAFLYNTNHKVKSAKSYYKKSLEIKKQLVENDDYKYMHEYLKCCLDFAVFLDQHEDDDVKLIYKDAMKYYDKVIESNNYNSLKDMALIAYGLGLKSSDNKAIEYLEKSINAFGYLNDEFAKEMTANIYNNVGTILIEDNKYEEANLYYRNAYAIFNELASKEISDYEIEIAYSMFGIGLSCDDLTEGREFLDSAYEIAKRHKQNEKCSQIVETLSQFKN